MRENTTKRKLNDGRVVFGAIVNEYAPSTVEVLGAIGYDFVMIDCEHGSMDLVEVENLVRASEVSGITPLARVPNHEPDTILRFLDRGVQGVIVPHVNTKEQAQAVVDAARYHPLGHRSVASTRAHGYNIGVTRAEGLEWQNEQTMVLPMCEDIESVKNLDAILSVPGIDVIQIAANDMAQSLGFPGDEEVRRVMREALAKCVAKGVYAGVGGNSPTDTDSVAEMINEGARFVTVPALGVLRLGAETFRSKVEEAITK